MLRFIVLWEATGCKAVSAIKSNHRGPSQTRTQSSPSHRSHQSSSVTYLTFSDQPFCIIFQMTFSITYSIANNGTLNLVKCIRAKCVYFGEWIYNDRQGSCSQKEGLQATNCKKTSRLEKHGEKGFLLVFFYKMKQLKVKFRVEMFFFRFFSFLSLHLSVFFVSFFVLGTCMYIVSSPTKKQ